MQRLTSKLPVSLYAITALNYAALIAVPLWLGRSQGCAVRLPDLDPFFLAAEFNQLYSCLAGSGDAGVVSFGRLHTFGADLTFPALFAASLIVLTWTHAKFMPRFAALPTALKFAFIAFMPISYALSDYTENMLVWYWLTTQTGQLNSITVATTLKFAFLAIASANLILFTLARLKSRRSS